MQVFHRKTKVILLVVLVVLNLSQDHIVLIEIQINDHITTFIIS